MKDKNNDTNMKEITFLCKKCGINLEDKVICDGMLCPSCWDKIKPE